MIFRRSFRSTAPVEGPGYLGPEYGPLSTGEKPRFGQPFRVRGITLGDGLTVEKYQSRRSLLTDIDKAYEGYEKLDESVRGLDRFSEQAYNIISSPRSRNAFNLSREPEREVERFGRHDFGQSMMLTSRLIESGVRFRDGSPGRLGYTPGQLQHTWPRAAAAF